MSLKLRLERFIYPILLGRIASEDFLIFWKGTNGRYHLKQLMLVIRMAMLSNTLKVQMSLSNLKRALCQYLLMIF